MAESIKENASGAPLQTAPNASAPGEIDQARHGDSHRRAGAGVTLKRRFDLEGAVRGQLSVLARAIEKQLNKI